MDGKNDPWKEGKWKEEWNNGMNTMQSMEEYLASNNW
jgi:hypothetical protein